MLVLFKLNYDAHTVRKIAIDVLGECLLRTYCYCCLAILFFNLGFDFLLLRLSSLMNLSSLSDETQLEDFQEIPSKLAGQLLIAFAMNRQYYCVVHLLDHKYFD